MLYYVSATDMKILERSHRFCLKYIQGIDKFSRTHIVLGLLGMYSIQSEIEKRKLMLFGQLCNLGSYSRIKELFLIRLASSSRLDLNGGYFKDIKNILAKYNLGNYLNTYVNTGIFPPSQSWKSIVKQSIKSNEELLWYQTSCNQDFENFTYVHPVLRESIIWHVCKNDYKMRFYCQNVIEMLSFFNRNSQECLCSCCGILYKDVIRHCIFKCANNYAAIQIYVNQIRTSFGNHVFRLITAMPEYELLGVLLGAPCDSLDILLDDDSYIDLIKNSICLIGKLWNKFQTHRS